MYRRSPFDQPALKHHPAVDIAQHLQYKMLPVTSDVLH
jgi:hypothetical protein